MSTTRATCGAVLMSGPLYLPLAAGIALSPVAAPAGWIALVLYWGVALPYAIWGK